MALPMAGTSPGGLQVPEISLTFQGISRKLPDSPIDRREAAMKALRPHLFLALYLAAAPLFAVTYKWVDESGTVVYSQNRPPVGVPYQTIDTGQPRPPASTTHKPSPSFVEQVDRENRARQAEQKAQGEYQKNLELRKKNCEAARHNLQVYTVHKRIQQEDGSVIRLDDNERSRKIEEAKEAIKEFCD